MSSIKPFLFVTLIGIHPVTALTAQKDTVSRSTGNVKAATELNRLKDTVRKSQKTYGPFELTASEMRLLSTSPKVESSPRTQTTNDKLPITRDNKTIKVTDRKFAGSSAEGNPQLKHPNQKPEPPNPTVQTPPVLVSWEVPKVYSGKLPPDPQIAVSKSHVLVTTHDGLFISNKDGVQQGHIDFDTFFESELKLDDNTVNGSRAQSDPRIIFDEYRKRFWLIHGAGNGPWQPPGNDPLTVRGRMYVAVSKSDNPWDGWWMYWWDAVKDWHIPNSDYQFGDVADYPSIGIDPLNFHQTIAVSNNQSERYSWTVIKPANDLANGIAAGGLQFIFKDLNQSKFTKIVQPAMHHGPTSRAYYVGRWDTDKLIVWAFEGSLMKAPVAVTLTPFGQVPDAPQKGSSLKINMANLSTNVLKVVYRNGLLYAVTNDAKDWFNDNKMLNSIRLVRMSVARFPKIPGKGDPSFINRVFGMNNIIDDNAKIDRMFYAWPAVEVNLNGNMIIVYARSGNTIYPEIRFSSYYNNESDIRPSRRLQAGEASYNNFRWGDVGGASVDPEDDACIWIVHQYAKANGNYGIWVGKVKP